jgi:iron-sulfur cluster repair protein YtfE (RIC family)
MTTSATEVLRATHAAFAPGIDMLRQAADAVGVAPDDVVDRLLDRVHTFFAEEVVPHAVAEDRVLYPAIERILGVPGSTAPMRRDHVELGRLVDRLDALRAENAVDSSGPHHAELRRVLHALDGLIRLHLAKEEELYLPLLDEQADEPWVAVLSEVMTAVVDSERALSAVLRQAPCLT